MAYIVKNSDDIDITEEFRNKEYGGSSVYQCELKIGDTLVPISQISSIKISSPLIDTTSETFYIGTFISQQLTIKFKNLDNLPIASGVKVELKIGTMIDEEMVYVPIGVYLIDDLSENYQTSCEITCLDYGVKFLQPVDYSKYMTDRKISIKQIFSSVCQECGVSYDTEYEWLNGEIETGYVDSTKSGKEYISYIAELEGCNAKIDRSGVLYLIPLKNTSSTTINALKSKSWELGEKYKITHVSYYDGVPRLHTFPKVETEKENELFIRQDNPFIVSESQIEKVYNRLAGLEIYSLKNENIGDITLDSWDLITFTLGDNISYTTFNHNDITYEQSIMTKIEPQIPTKQQESAVNILDNDKVFKKTIKANIDTIEGKIETIAEETTDNSSKITTIEQSLNGLQVGFQKSGNNLVRNTMFYNFEGWSTMGGYNIARGDTPPSGKLSPNYWYCTKTSALYESGKVYSAVRGDEDIEYWEETDILISNLEKSFPIPSVWSLESNANIRSKYLSGRVLVGNQNYGGEFIPNISSDLFEITTDKTDLTLSLRAYTQIKGESSLIVSVSLYEDSYTNPYYAYQPIYSIVIDKDVSDELLSQKFLIPKSTDTLSVYSSDTEPTDTSVIWLKTISEDNIVVGTLYTYDGEWKQFSNLKMLKDQNNHLFFPSTYCEYGEETTIATTYYSYSYNGEWNDSYIPTVGEIMISMGTFDATSKINVKLGDLKLEYGDYSEWTPKRTEVVGLTHLLDETGYKISSGDDQMRIMTDEIAQYYKDEKMFYLNKTTGYFKNALCETNNVNGLVTQKFKVGTKTIYGRYIQ